MGKKCDLCDFDRGTDVYNRCVQEFRELLSSCCFVSRGYTKWRNGTTKQKTLNEQQLCGWKSLNGEVRGKCPELFMLTERI